MNSFPENLVNEMTKMGFTIYEAKTYLGLLERNPATGYEVSKEANVPRSVIYSVLSRLESMGIVSYTHDKPRRYIPLSPKQLLSKLETDFDSRLTTFSDELLKYNNKPETEGFWNINGYEMLIKNCDSLVREAKETIFISGWKREIDRIKDSLLAAKKRGVDIIIFSFTKVPKTLGQVFAYGIDEEKLSSIWDHKIILVVDSKNLIMGPANIEKDEQSIWTQSKAVLTIAINYIILDITLFGQRMKQDISDTVVKLMTKRVDFLDHLIELSIHNEK